MRLFISLSACTHTCTCKNGRGSDTAVKTLLAKLGSENCQHFCLIWVWWGICEMLEGTAAALRIVWSLKLVLQDEILVVFGLWHKCLVSVHCLAGHSPWCFLFFFNLFFPFFVPFTSWVSRSNSVSRFWHVFGQSYLSCLCVCVSLSLTHSAHIHTDCPCQRLTFPNLCAHTHTRAHPAQRLFLFSTVFALLRVFSHACSPFSKPSSSQSHCLYPSPLSALFEYSFTFTVPLSSVFFTLVVSLAIWLLSHLHPSTPPRNQPKICRFCLKVR